MVGLDQGFWRGCRVFLTGHTGFKGSWLTVWLSTLGAKIVGFSLPPYTQPNLFSLVAQGLATDIYGDVTDNRVLLQALADADPEIIIHMAAQSLVRPSYVDPLGTFATNILGTANLLDGARHLSNLRAVLVVTSDKVYENQEKDTAFSENDALGGYDPYSASKAGAEIITASFRRSFFASGPRVASARAGNVIGGGDWAPFRIMTDIVAARAAGQPVELRYPRSVRPWQHVLEPLAGYLMYVEALAGGHDVPNALNFGPEPTNFRTVAELADAFTTRWSGKPGWVQALGSHSHEASHLTLSPEKARRSLGWAPLLTFDETVGWTADWYASHTGGKDVSDLTRSQIADFSARLQTANRSTALAGADRTGSEATSSGNRGLV